MERYYSLMGPTDAFGSRVQWFSLAKKIQRKVEEFSRPSPLNSLLGTVTSMAGAGGASVGCAAWEQCKTHIRYRSTQYFQIGVVSMMSMILILFAAIGCVGVLVLYNFEASESKKKKKKKKEENPCELTPKGKTFLAAAISAFCSFSGTVAFLVVTDASIHAFKKTGSYPYASAHIGAYVAGFGSVIMIFISIFLLHRVKPFCGGGGKSEENEGFGEQYSQYGPPAGGPGPYGGMPSGPYGGLGSYAGGSASGGAGW